MLSNNELSEIRVDMWKGLQNLLNLDLSYNRLRTLPTGGFHSLHDLITLELAGNELNEISPDMFDGLDNLASLHISDNMLTALLPGTFAFIPGLEFVSLSGNPFHCDEDLCWLKEAEEKGEMSFWFGSSPECMNYPRRDWNNVNLECK